MTYEYNLLEWEVTTNCNAACPQCPRNYYGGKTWSSLPVINNNLEWAKKHLPSDFINNLDRIDFCGTYGDPILNNDLPNIIEWLLTVNPSLEISLKTNGGLRDTSWWARLAKVIGPKGYVFFSIDGLADTNHLYRRKVSFNKAIDNAKAFINAGGKAYWNYIVFKHNQHQVEEAHALSKELSFADFNIKRTSRFFNKKHEIQQTLAVYSEEGEVEYHIEIPTDPQYINSSYSKIEFIKTKDTLKNYFKNTSVTCKSKNLKKLYLSADGYVFPCGWLADRIYGYEVESNNDTIELEKLFELAGGKEVANVNHTDIHQIINGAWFDKLESSWTADYKLERCGAICGDQIDLINDQNELVKIY